MNLKQKAKSAREGLRLAKLRGVRIGRPPSADRPQMVAMRTRGITIREIARLLKCSTATVQRAIAEEQ